MGAGDEQCETLCGGDRDERDYLSLKKTTAERNQTIPLGGDIISVLFWSIGEK